MNFATLLLEVRPLRCQKSDRCAVRGERGQHHKSDF